MNNTNKFLTVFFLIWSVLVTGAAFYVAKDYQDRLHSYQALQEDLADYHETLKAKNQKTADKVIFSQENRILTRSMLLNLYKEQLEECRK